MSDDPLATLAALVHREGGDHGLAWLCRAVGRVVEPGLCPEGDARSIVDAIVETSWRTDTEDRRIALGRVYTPRAIARQLLHEVGYDGAATLQGHLLDPACGGGVFLVEALRARVAADPASDVAAGLRWIHGLDIDALAVELATATLATEAGLLVGFEPTALDALPRPSVHHQDGLAELPDTVPPPQWTVGNPPYLEAKRMGRPVRSELKARFGTALFGAWDLYMVFLEVSMRRRTVSGRVGFVLPNKFLVARYAERFRDRVNAEGLAAAVVDLSSLPVFRKVGVYPIILVLGPTEGRCRTVSSVPSLDGLGERMLPGVEVPHGLWRAAGGVWFPLLSQDWVPWLQSLGSHTLEELAHVRSTCSFHKKGLRERFVRPQEELPAGVPYLGGRSYSRRNEVGPFRVRWEGFCIDWDEGAHREQGNPLPPRALFDGPKVILCQHARGVIAAADVEGRFITKDVYPVVVPHRRTVRQVRAITALLNSRVITATYLTRHRGIQVGGGYLHVLPVFLRRIPVPPWTDDLVDELAALAEQMEADAPEVLTEIDRVVEAAWGLSPDAVVAFHEEAARAGFDMPVYERH